MSSSKEVILQRLRSAKLSGNLYENMEKPDSKNPFLEVNSDTISVFKTALETISGKCFVVEKENLKSELSSYLESISCKKLYSTSRIADVSNELKSVDVAFGDAQIDEHPVAMSDCECLSARTGSVLVSSATSEGRKTHSFAETHIVIANADQLVSDIPDAIQFLTDKYNGTLPSAVTLISGQSRTADIEKTLILGAHGPKNLTVFIVK